MNGTNSRDEWRKSPIKHQISPNDVDEKKSMVCPFFLAVKEGLYLVLFKSFFALLLLIETVNFLMDHQSKR